jgi:coenzyme F420-0:L-glutamate ligase / coenzyme F420-1:gamma-L-glutamate ligase
MSVSNPCIRRESRSDTAHVLSVNPLQCRAACADRGHRDCNVIQQLSITGLQGIAIVQAGDDLGALLAESLARAQLVPESRDVLAVAQKVVSKAEGRHVRLSSVSPSARALELAERTKKDARVVELILSESTEVLRAVPGVLITRHALGFVCANAGIDLSNVGEPSAEETALLLPRDPDGSAERLRQKLHDRFGIAPAVLVTDSFGRAWRLGTVNVALGAAGIPCLIDRRGDADLFGRTLQATEVAFADAVAAAAGLVMGEAREACPAVHIRGLGWSGAAQPATALLRPVREDLFQ